MAKKDVNAVSSLEARTRRLEERNKSRTTTETGRSAIDTIKDVYGRDKKDLKQVIDSAEADLDDSFIHNISHIENENYNPIIMVANLALFCSVGWMIMAADHIVNSEAYADKKLAEKLLKQTEKAEKEELRGARKEILSGISQEINGITYSPQRKNMEYIDTPTQQQQTQQPNPNQGKKEEKPTPAPQNQPAEKKLTPQVMPGQHEPSNVILRNLENTPSFENDKKLAEEELSARFKSVDGKLDSLKIQQAIVLSALTANDKAWGDFKEAKEAGKTGDEVEALEKSAKEASTLLTTARQNLKTTLSEAQQEYDLTLDTVTSAWKNHTYLNTQQFTALYEQLETEVENINKTFDEIDTNIRNSYEKGGIKTALDLMREEEKAKNPETKGTPTEVQDANKNITTETVEITEGKEVKIEEESKEETVDITTQILNDEQQEQTLETKVEKTEVKTEAAIEEGEQKEDKEVKDVTEGEIIPDLNIATNLDPNQLQENQQPLQTEDKEVESEEKDGGGTNQLFDAMLDQPILETGEQKGDFSPSIFDNLISEEMKSALEQFYTEGIEAADKFKEQASTFIDEQTLELSNLVGQINKDKEKEEKGI